ncbi:MAG: hypothetical protein HKL80_00715 [Acidimicrobiales bacterium]|nr:hypothetical protein [Acidimicrobiales bacterium]
MGVLLFEIGVDVRGGTPVQQSVNSQSFASALAPIIVNDSLDKSLLNKIRTEVGQPNLLSQLVSDSQTIELSTEQNYLQVEKLVGKTRNYYFGNLFANAFLARSKGAKLLADIFSEISNGSSLTTLEYKMEESLSLFRSADSQYGQAISKIRSSSSAIRLPGSKWLTPTKYWSDSSVLSWLETVVNSPELSNTNQLSLVTWSISPQPVSYSQVGQMAILPPTSSVLVTVVAKNESISKVDNVIISAILTDQNGKQETRSSQTELSQSQSETITLGAFSTISSGNYKLSIQVGALNNSAVSGDSKSAQFSIAPS